MLCYEAKQFCLYLLVHVNIIAHVFIEHLHVHIIISRILHFTPIFSQVPFTSTGMHPFNPSSDVHGPQSSRLWRGLSLNINEV